MVLGRGGSHPCQTKKLLLGEEEPGVLVGDPGGELMEEVVGELLMLKEVAIEETAVFVA